MAAMILHEPSAWVTGARYCHRLHDLVNPFEGIPKYQLGEWFHGDDRPDRYSRYALWHDKLFYLPPSSELSLPFGNPLFVSVDIDFTVKRFGFTLLFGEALKIGPLSRTARPLAHTNTKISPISTINYSTKIGDLLAL